MKAANRNQFFKTTLGFKAVSAPNDPKETWLIPTDSDIKSEMILEWQIPARDAAYNAFMEKLAANEVPVFTSDELDPKGEFQNGYVKYTQALLDELALNYLAQAIIDDEREIVKAMLDKKPELLLRSDFVIATSEHTSQRFSSANFLGLACLRKQMEMVKIITPYFDRLIAGAEVDEEEIARVKLIKKAGLAQWFKYQIDANGEIQVPAEYQAIIDDLIRVFTSETIPTNTRDYRRLSTNIETAMETLYNRLLPDFKKEDKSERRVLTKQNYLDVELLLNAAYRTYYTRFDSFSTWEQRTAFSIRVVGILQNFLHPETAKIFCLGVFEVLNNRRSKSAHRLKLGNVTPFYSKLDSGARVGLGFETCARLHFGKPWAQGLLVTMAKTPTGGDDWDTFVKLKQELWEHYIVQQESNESTLELRA